VTALPTASCVIPRSSRPVVRFALPEMKHFRVRLRCATSILALLASLLTPVARAQWQREDGSLAWLEGQQVVWKFSFDPKSGKPFFHPLSVAGGPSLTNFRPEDHPWHYGLWFSWKYINGVNYWEEDRETRKAEGATRWTVAAIDTRPDGGATLSLDLTYTHPSGRVDLTERRVLRISRPALDGSYAIDWRSDFKAGPEGAVLDRTPLLGEPNGKVNGGYAGLGLRLASAPLDISFVSSAAPITRFEQSRARPAAAAVAANLFDGGKAVGGIAIFSDPANAGTRAPWYLINAPRQQMRFVCPAVLAPKPIALAPGGQMRLHYTIALRRAAWTPEALQVPATGLASSRATASEAR
jgi:hypothetical protein